MKRIILNCAACLLLITAIVACSSESTVDLTTDTTAVAPERESRSNAWDGIIGEDKGNDVYEITADKQALLADLQANIDKETAGSPVTLETLDIVKKNALNDSGDTGYMLIATDNRGVSIGVMLSKQIGSFKLDNNQFQAPTTVSCWGCTHGCNLQYLYIDGKKIPICNENGCGSDCVKKETELK